MMVQCWPTVRHAGPTLGQNWANLSCFFGWFDQCDLSDAEPTLNQHWFNVLYLPKIFWGEI